MKIKNNIQKKFPFILAFFVVLSVLVFPSGQYKIVNAMQTTWNFSYNGTNGMDGSAQIFSVPYTGKYKLEVWGAQGGDANNSGQGGKGGYSYGEIDLTKGQNLYVYVGGRGTFTDGNAKGDKWKSGGGFNGGGPIHWWQGLYVDWGYYKGWLIPPGGVGGPGGGGGTDIRVNDAGLGSRVIVAGGGGGSAVKDYFGIAYGGYGGGSSGGGSTGGSWVVSQATGGTQTGVGKGATLQPNTDNGESYNGYDGYQNEGGDCYGYVTGGGGGGGYYGGGSGGGTQSVGQRIARAGGAGGSGYVGGIKNGQTIGGNQSFPSPNGPYETGHTGDGFARITLIDATPPTVTLSASNTAPTNQPVTVNVNATDDTAVSQVKWASGNQPASYFSNAGTVLSGNTFTVNTNGVYTVYAMDISEKTTVQTINISNIYILSTPTLSINNVTSNTMDVNITDSNTLAVQYQISTSINGQNYYITSSGTLSTSQQSITPSNKKIIVTGLTPNTTYTFQACAIYNTVISSLSSPISRTTLVTVPIGVTCTPSDNSVAVSWSQVAGASTYYISNDGVNTIGSTATTSYTQTGLSPGTKYNYYVKAGNANGSSSWSSGVSAITILDTPTNVVATSSQESITISWSPVNGATGYDVIVDGNLSSTSNTTITISGLTAGTNHSYDVRAKNAVTISNWSLQGNKLTNITAPLTPTNLSATTTGSAITLSWNPSATATTYEINADGNIINSGINTVYMVTGLAPGTTHTYMVRALNSGGKSSWSSSISAATAALAPNVPTNLTAVTTGSSITISWNAVPNATSYDIETSTTTGSGIAVNDVNVANTTYTYNLPEVTTSTAITFKVRSEVGNTPSDWSETITVIPGSNPTGSPQNITANSADTSVTLCWDHLSNATSYDIEENGTIVGNVVNSVTFTRTGLTPNTQYNYRVRGENTSGPGSWSNYVTATTLAAMPLGVPGNIIATPTENSISLIWNTVSGATSYDIEINGGNTQQNTTGSAITLSNLNPNTPYSFRVRAVNANGTGAWSGVVTTSTLQLGQANGPGSASATITENVMQNGEFIILFNTSDIQNLSDATFAVTYDPSVLTVEDLCATTPFADITVGNIQGTDLSVTTFDAQSGTIVFKLNTTVSQGQSYTGMVTAIKFKANTNGQSKIKFIADQGGN